jgi:outer membrane protein assembly factor BamB
VDDDRLLSSLRRIAEPVDASEVFLDRLYETLAGELGFRGKAPSDAEPARRPSWVRTRRVSRLTWLAAAALLALGIAVGAAVVAAFLERSTPPPPPAFSDVTSYRADPERSGVQPGPGPGDDPVLIWSVKAAGPIQFNPVLAQGILYVGSDDGHLYALGADTGAKRWAFDAGAAVRGSAVVEAGLIAVTDANSVLHVVDAATGTQRWEIGGILDVGDVSDGVLYSAGEDGVHGFDVQTGTERWTWLAPAPVPYVAIAGDTAYITSGGTLYAVGLADRAERWHHDTGGTAGSLATIAADRVFVSARQGAPGLTALDRATGSPFWTFRAPSGNQANLGSIRNGVVFAPTVGPDFYALAASDGKVLWHVASGSTLRATPIVDDTVYAAIDDPGGVVALRASDGATRWKRDLGGPMQGWPVVSGGFVFTTDATGEIHAYGDRARAGPNGPVTVSTPLNEGAIRPSSEPTMPPDPSTVVSTLLPATTGLVDALDMDIGPDGNIYVVDRRPMVSVISPDGRLLAHWGHAGSDDGGFEFFVPNLGSVAKIVVGRDGLVYVSDANNGRVQVFTSTGGYVTQLGNRGANADRLVVPWDIGLDKAGNVYVIDTGLGSLSKFDSAGTFLWRVGGVGASEPELRSGGHGVRFDPSGRLWIASDDIGRLIALDADDGHGVDAFGELGSRPGQLAAPCGLDFDPAGNLYVYNCIGGRMQVFDPEHHLIGLWDGPTDDRRNAFAFTPDGRMYQLGLDDTIREIRIDLP